MKRSLSWTAGVVVLSLLGACATFKPSRPVQAGDQVRLAYVCKRPNGALLDANDPALAAADKGPRDDVFRAPEAAEPLTVTAGRPDDEIEGYIYERPLAIREQLALALARAVEGLPYGRSTRREIRGLEQQGLPDGARFLEMACVRRRVKQQAVSLAQFKAGMGHDPVIGEEVPAQPGFTGRVGAVTNDSVAIDYTPIKPTFETDFGAGQIIDRGDHYDIELPVREGNLVRSGNALGRIVAVGPQTFHVDYGLGFGGEPLTCDILPEPVLIEQSAK